MLPCREASMKASLSSLLAIASLLVPANAQPERIAYEIHGVVRHGLSLEPIAGAVVELRAVGAPWLDEAIGQATSDSEGSYRLDGVGPGLYQVVARASGLVSAVRNDMRPDATADLFLFPGTTLAGRVTDLRGRPLRSARVWTEAERTDHPPVSPAVTDEGGRYAFAGLPAGSYRVVAQHPLHALAVLNGVPVAQEGGARADLTLAAPARIVGRIRRATAGERSATVRLAGLDGRPTPRPLLDLLRAAVGAEDRFQLDFVPPGEHALVVECAGFAPRSVPVSVSATSVDVGDVEIASGVTLRGRVVTSTGVGVPNARVSVSPLLALPARGDVQTASDGSWSFAGLQSCPCQIRADAPGFGEGTAHSEMEADDIKIVLSGVGSLTGRVEDEQGRPVTGFALTPRFARTVIGPDGTFVVDDVPQGTHRVSILAPGFLRASLEEIRLDAGQRIDLGRVRLQRGARVAGVVLDPSGRPLPGARVRVRAGGEWVAGESVADMRGGFALDGLPADALEARVTHPRFAETRAAADAKRQPAEVLRVVMSQGARLEVRAHRRDGSGVAGLLVQALPLRAEGGTDFAAQTPVVTTDGTGRAILDNIPEGRVRVLALGRGSGPMPTSRDLEVRDGDRQTVELAIPQVRLHGRVTRGGAPVPGVLISLGVPTPAAIRRRRPNLDRHRALTRPDGGYELLADKPGPALVWVDTPDGRHELLREVVEVPDADQQRIDLVLPAATVSGVVVDKDSGAPVPEAQVQLSSGGLPAPLVALTDKAGRFRIDVDPGQYHASVSADAYVRGGIDLKVGAGGSSDLHLRLSYGQKIHGRVVGRTGRGLGGVTVSALWAEEGPALTAQIETGKDGIFALTGLRMGRYNLFVPVDVAGFAFLPGVEAGSQDVTLELRPGGYVSFRIVGEGGEPIRGARALITKVAGIPVMGYLSREQTDDQGRMTIVLPGGAIDIQVRHTTGAAKTSLTVPAEGSLDVQVSLRR